MLTVTVKTSLRYISTGAASAIVVEAEGGRGRRRRQDRVDAGVEDDLEIALDQRAHLLRPEVVGVVVAGRQHVGADHDAPLDLACRSRRRGCSRTCR